MHEPEQPNDKIHLAEHTLERSLSGSLEEQEQSAIQQHLSDCLHCRDRLDQLAASGEVWSRIGEVLKAEASSQRSLASASTSQLLPSGEYEPLGAPRYPSEFATAPADFAVSFLDPATRSDSMGRLGEFEILSVIGCGGMGIVLKGFQEELNRPVAVKVLAPHLATSGAARQRFLREAQATAAIVHPNVMPILSVSEKARLPFLVMPYVACHSLQQRLDREGPLAVVDILRIALQVAHGLAAAHAQGLVHRDVKPANILLERGVDRVMLTDFGLARAIDDATITRSGVIAGTPQYMSPEQVRGDPIDTRSDLFSLGCVIYAMCAGRPPFRGDTSYGILRKITDQSPHSLLEINSSIPQWLERLVWKLLAKNVDERYARADQVASLLETCLSHVQQPTAVELPPLLQLPRRTSTQRWKKALIGGGLLLAITGGLAWQALAPPHDATVFSEQQSTTSEVGQADFPAQVALDDEQITQEIEQLKAETERIVRSSEALWPEPATD